MLSFITRVFELAHEKTRKSRKSISQLVRGVFLFFLLAVLLSACSRVCVCEAVAGTRRNYATNCALVDCVSAFISQLFSHSLQMSPFFSLERVQYNELRKTKLGQSFVLAQHMSLYVMFMCVCVWLPSTALFVVSLTPGMYCICVFVSYRGWRKRG